jgi:hypothetical protein
MSKTAKSLLIPSVVCTVVGGAFNLGVINAHDIDAFYTILPMGAVFFGLFLIVVVLEKENALYDQDHRLSGPAEGNTHRH